MAKFKDITGQRFGRLTALCVSGRRNGIIYWKLRCDCGAIVEVAVCNLSRTQSCGCLRNERVREATRKRAEERLKGEHLTDAMPVPRCVRAWYSGGYLDGNWSSPQSHSMPEYSVRTK